MDLIEIWRHRTKEDKAALKRLLAQIAKSKSKKINQIADKIHEEVFQEIDCLDCANCCKCIPPILNEMDIKKAAKFLGMKPSNFKNQYIRIDEDMDMVMISSPCPFLENDNKCSIYDSRPRACREYPHTDNYEFQQNIKLHLNNSDYCPAVYHILDRMQKQE